MKNGEILFDNHIDELIEIITNYFKNNNWNEEFEKWFVKVYNDFDVNLSKRTPYLTPQKIKICALIKIGMRNKEISHLLHIHEKTVEAHRIHIRKK